MHWIGFIKLYRKTLSVKCLIFKINVFNILFGLLHKTIVKIFYYRFYDICEICLKTLLISKCSRRFINRLSFSLHFNPHRANQHPPQPPLLRPVLSPPSRWPHQPHLPPAPSTPRHCVRALPACSATPVAPPTNRNRKTAAMTSHLLRPRRNHPAAKNVPSSAASLPNHRRP